MHCNLEAITAIHLDQSRSYVIFTSFGLLVGKIHNGCICCMCYIYLFALMELKYLQDTFSIKIWLRQRHAWPGCQMFSNSKNLNMGDYMKSKFLPLLVGGPGQARCHEVTGHKWFGLDLYKKCKQDSIFTHFMVLSHLFFMLTFEFCCFFLIDFFFILMQASPSCPSWNKTDLLIIGIKVMLLCVNIMWAAKI